MQVKLRRETHPNRSAALFVALAIISSGCSITSEPPQAQAQRPNILLIMADDLGFSDIGAFGGEIKTPNIDALLASGRALTNYYTGATCSPTRAMVMSGTDHHLAGLGTMAEFSGQLIARGVAPWGESNRFNLKNLPAGYEGYLNDQVAPIAQVLKDNGYHTYLSGKWHIALQPAEMPQPPAPPTPYAHRKEAFPQAKGFERSFSLLQGAGSHFAPVPGKVLPADFASTWVEDDKPVKLPQDFYSSTSFTDKLIEYIDSNKGDGRPFFAWLAYTAPHWPLMAPDEDIARYAGKYDEGYEAIQARRLERQKQLGLIPRDFSPSQGLGEPLGRPKWQNLTAAQRQSEARKMEVYAAMVENMDRNIGRLVQYLKSTSRYENTLIVFTSDNGAEGGPSQYPNTPETDNSVGNQGRRLSNVAYGERWAEVSATPFKLFKSFSSEGGVTAPLIVRMPKQGAAQPPFADRTHVADLYPTFLEAAGVSTPHAVYKNQPIAPITGKSLYSALSGHSKQSVRSDSDIVAGELFGGRYVIRGQWKLVSVQAPFGDNAWELFDLHADRGELHNVIAKHPEIADSLKDAYQAYAAKVGVIPSPASLGRAPAP